MHKGQDQVNLVDVYFNVISIVVIKKDYVKISKSV